MRTDMRAEKVLGDQAAGGRLLIPHHHQHDQLELFQRERVARGGERALDHQLARLWIEDARVLERQQEAAALRVKFGNLARRERAERALRVRQTGELRVRPCQHAGEPVQRLADVGVLEPGGGQLLRHAVAVVGDFGLLAILEHVGEDVVHKHSLLINAALGIGFTGGPPSRDAGRARREVRSRGRRAPDAAAPRRPAPRKGPRASKANPRPPDRGPCV